LAPFLYILAYKFFCVLFENFVYFVQDGIDVFAQLLVPFLDVGSPFLGDLGLVGLILAAGGLGLPATGLSCGHRHLRLAIGEHRDDRCSTDISRRHRREHEGHSSADEARDGSCPAPADP